MVMLLNIMGTWNEYITALTFIRDESKYTIAIGLSYLTNSGVYDVNYGRTFAGLAIALIPILIPLLISSVRRAYELAEAMECRCYNGGEGRTRMKQMHIKPRDFAVLAVCAVVCGGIITLNILF